MIQVKQFNTTTVANEFLASMQDSDLISVGYEDNTYVVIYRIRDVKAQQEAMIAKKEKDAK